MSPNPLLLAVAAAALGLAGCQTTGPARDVSGESVVPGAQAPGKDQVYVELAAAYLMEGQIGVALAKAQQAVEVNPSSSNGHNVLGLVYERMGEAGKAETEYQESLRLSPDNYYAHNAYGAFLCKQRRFADRRRSSRRRSPIRSTRARGSP